MKNRFIKKTDKPKKKRQVIPLRLNILFFVIFILFSALILRLGVVQIVQGETYKRQLEETDDVSVTKNVPRGVIYDRNYNLLVGNSAVKSITYARSEKTPPSEMISVAKKLDKLIAITPEKLTERDLQDYWILTNEKESMARLSKADKNLDGGKVYKKQIAGVTKDDLDSLTEDDKRIATIYKKMTTGYALSQVAVKSKGVTDEEIAKVSENLESLPGVDTTTDWNRFYTYDETLRSILGSVSTEKQGIPSDKVDYYLAQGYSRNDRVGRSYLEAQYESVLAGQKSKSNSVLDSNGNIIETVEKYEGSKGKDLVLSVDVELQKRIEEIIRKNMQINKGYSGTDLFDRAFVVATDPYSGQVLALAGQKFDDKGGFEDYSLGNFTTAYNMGSAVKGATVLGGIMDGAISENQTFFDQPIKFKGTKAKSSWFNRSGEGGRTLDPVGALEISSNSFMYQVSMKMAGAKYVYDGPFRASPETFDTMRYYYNQFGLGVRTGIDLPGEQIGYKGPDDTVGKILDFAIGQYDSYTPLQLAQYGGTIANGGYRIEPTMLKEIRDPSTTGDTVGKVATEIEPKILNRIGAPSSAIKEVQKGFYEVTHGSSGTGRAYFNDLGVEVAGKTGTAEAFYDGPKKGEAMTEVWNTTFVGYAPAEKPEISIAVVVPWGYRKYGGSDSKINLKISEEVFKAYYDLKEERAKAGKDTSKVDQPINNKAAAAAAQSKLND
ncbi:transpeptidase, penicillin binding protein [Listeria grandensis FSL F6-0971]|uniref:Transpeptidase, penicillin binding protein n=2 Tax=Listeria grandensis TaxID=1494963 RepID=W7BCY0_9LIST|nr:penicillin-binding protein 2 [Listeria grandensis]EUJ24979.1 transpeptidase, penicillin binding protein [Listeria grandensis FSL F6-0971]MBC1934948.1 penicillin-binding protein 2 [Listeria grandensis]